MAKQWRGGMIGAGAWSHVQLAAWAAVENAEIVAVCDRHADRLQALAHRCNITQTFEDVAAMLDQATLDFVDICTRPYAHASLIRLAADRGLPILCQKPFCISMHEAREAVEHCKKAGVRLMINENFRWQPWYRKSKALLESGALGNVFFARIHERSRLTLPQFDHRQAYLAEMPRLVVYEMGVHYLDTFRFLFGEPDCLFVRLHHVSPHVQGEDVQIITVGYTDLTGLINHSWASVLVPGVDVAEEFVSVRAPRLEIDGTAGTLVLKADGSLHLVSDGSHQQWQFSGDVKATSHTAAQQHFIDCLGSGAEFETSGAETLKTMGLVYACYRSAAEGRVVRPAELLE